MQCAQTVQTQAQTPAQQPQQPQQTAQTAQSQPQYQQQAQTQPAVGGPAPLSELEPKWTVGGAKVIDSDIISKNAIVRTTQTDGHTGRRGAQRARRGQSDEVAACKIRIRTSWLH